MAATTDHPYLGHWYTRRVRLEPNEAVLLSSAALEIFIFGSAWPGSLFLTSKRLIFTPWLWLILPPTRTIERGEIEGGEITDKRALGVGGRYYFLDILGRERRSTFGFFGFPGRQKKLAYRWLDAMP